MAIIVSIIVSDIIVSNITIILLLLYPHSLKTLTSLPSYLSIIITLSLVIIIPIILLMISLHYSLTLIMTFLT